MKTKLALSILLLTLFFSFEKGKAQAPAWAWAKSGGGMSEDYVNSMNTDPSGNVLVTGYFQSDSITFGTTTLTNAGGRDIFIVKYDASGNVLWAKSAGGISGDFGNDISTDGSGNVLLTGFFDSPSITFGTTTLTNASGFDNIFLVKYDTSGNVLWAESAGDNAKGNGISSDGSGNVFVTGYFYSPSITFGTTTLVNTGSKDFFVVKYDTWGNVQWAKSASGISDDYGNDISTDANGNVVVIGYSDSPAITFGTSALTNPGSGDIFIVKYDALGNVLWAKSEGGTSWDYSRAIYSDGSGNVVVTGYFDSATITFGTTTLTNAGSGTDDIFVVKYDASGTVLWAKSAGGTSWDAGIAICMDGNGNILVAGIFTGPTIIFGTTTLSNAGSSDFFVVKYDTSGTVLWAKSAGGIYDDSVYGIATDVSGNVLVAGEFQSPSINLGATTLINAGFVGSNDILVAKLDNTMGIAGVSTRLSMTSVYPNPATDYLTINTGSNKKQVITISDITGKIIYSTTTLVDKTIINTKDFPQGVYAVQVQAGDAVETRKVVVTR